MCYSKGFLHLYSPIGPEVTPHPKMEQTLVNVLTASLSNDWRRKGNWNIGTSIKFICRQLGPGKFGEGPQNILAWAWRFNLTFNLIDTKSNPYVYNCFYSKTCLNLGYKWCRVKVLFNYKAGISLVSAITTEPEGSKLLFQMEFYAW